MAPFTFNLIVLLGLASNLSVRAADAPTSVADRADDLEAKLAEARRLHLTDSTRSRKLAEEALETARTRQDPANEAVALIELAIALRRQNHNGTAVQHVRQALAIAETLTSRPLLRRALKETGHTCWAFGDLPKATDYFQRALRLCEEDGDIPGQTDAHAGLSAVAADLKDTVRARTHAVQALTLAEKAEDRGRIAFYASNLANSYFHEKNYAKARALYQRAFEIFTQLDQRTSVADVRTEFARIDEAEGRLAEAERTLRDVLPSRRRLRGRVKLTGTLVQLADVVRQQGRTDEALAFLNEAWGYAAQLAPPSQLLVLDSLTATHEARGDLAAALKTLRQRQDVAEAQRGEAVQARATELREAFAAERREAEIARLRQAASMRATELRAKEAELRAQEAEHERGRWQRYGVISALAFGVITLGALVSRQRLKARTDRRILEEARAAQRSAEEADRVKTRFLGIASHDIRSPLGNILHLTSELRLTRRPNPDDAERFDIIGSEAQRVLSLVEDLITTAALESGKLEIRPAPMDLAETTREVVHGLDWQAQAKRQTIEFTASPDAGQITGDASRLRQVVTNLVSNAIKFSPPGQTIRIELRREDSRVKLVVRDHGAGIAEADIPRLFAPFERLASHPTAGESSHGLGLSIAQEIARQHGGVIRAESRPGEGSTFTLDLPA